jgi:hypothetical protein
VHLKASSPLVYSDPCLVHLKASSPLVYSDLCLVQLLVATEQDPHETTGLLSAAQPSSSSLFSPSSECWAGGWVWVLNGCDVFVGVFVGAGVHLCMYMFVHAGLGV